MLANLSMLQEYFDLAHVDGVYWSLTIEITFYGWILLLLACGQVRRAPHWMTLGLVTCGGGWAVGYFGIALWRLRRLALLDTFPFFALGMGFYLFAGNGRWIGRAKARSYCRGRDRRRAGEPDGSRACRSARGVGTLLPGRARVPALDREPGDRVFRHDLVLAVSRAPEHRIHCDPRQRADFGSAASIAVAACVALTAASALTFLIERPAMIVIRAWWKRRRILSVAGAA
jgi:peptidoglycan/LPS O-acetylase OafA/YrhL